MWGATLEDQHDEPTLTNPGFPQWFLDQPLAKMTAATT
jgi:hypothetical protein